MSKPIIMWAAVDGRTLNGILGVTDNDMPIGTNFGAMFFKRKFAKALAREWNGDARVVKVRIEEVVPHA